MTTCRMVAYYRVSTKGQGQSGLGIEAQRAAVLSHVERAGCDLVAEYEEVESGKRDDRSQLAKAIAHARAAKATLVVAKLDRLSRKALFILRALEEASDLPFAICDLPGATRLTVTLYAAIAEEEGKKISERTREALAARKARGLPLGVNVTGQSHLTTEGAARGRAKAARTHRSKALQAYEHLLPLIQALRDEGHGYATIAQILYKRGFSARRSTDVAPKRFTAMQIRRILSYGLQAQETL